MGARRAAARLQGKSEEVSLVDLHKVHLRSLAQQGPLSRPDYNTPPQSRP